MVYQLNRVIDKLDEIDELVPLAYGSADAKCGLVEARVFANSAMEMLKDKNERIAD